MGSPALVRETQQVAHSAGPVRAQPARAASSPASPPPVRQRPARAPSRLVGLTAASTRPPPAVSPRVCRVVALGAPSERERTSWYFQRYVCHLPAAGEARPQPPGAAGEVSPQIHSKKISAHTLRPVQIVLFDRSWYNRAGVERVMGFCTDAEYEQARKWACERAGGARRRGSAVAPLTCAPCGAQFMSDVPIFEKMLVESGIKLVKARSRRRVFTLCVGVVASARAPRPAPPSPPPPRARSTGWTCPRLSRSGGSRTGCTAGAAAEGTEGTDKHAHA